MAWKPSSTSFGLIVTIIMSSIATFASEIPRITPNEPDITFNEDVLPMLQCHSDKNITWYFSSHIQDFDASPYFLIENNFNGVPDAQYSSTLTFLNPSDTRLVGYYYCVPVQWEYDTLPSADLLAQLYATDDASRIYVYMDYANTSLYVGDQPYVISGSINEDVYIPCIPTRKDVTVTITENEKLLDVEYDRSKGYRYTLRSRPKGEIQCLFEHNGTTAESKHMITILPKEKRPSRPIIESEKGKFVEEGSDMQLKCIVKKDFTLAVSWKLPTHSNANLENRVEYEKFQQNGNVMHTLVVKNVHVNDTGLYQCIVQTPSKNFSSIEEIPIKVYESNTCMIDVDEIGMNNITVEKHAADVRWVVYYDGYSKPLSVEWIDHHQRIVSDQYHDGNKYKYENVAKLFGRMQTSLTVHNPVLQDMGTYTLRIHDGHTDSCRKELQYHLYVREAPVIGDIPDATVKFGARVGVSCIVVGYPPSVIQWTWRECPVNGNEQWDPMQCARSLAIVSFETEANTVAHNDKFQNSTLWFQPNGPGLLTCSAHNDVSVASEQSAAIYVIDRSESFVVEPLQDVVTEADDMRIACMVEQYNYTDQLRWYNGDKLLEQTDDGRVTVTNDRTLSFMHRSVLRINPIGQSESGEYWCEATAFAGDEVRKRDFTLLVHPTQSPVFRDYPGDEITAPKQTLQINERLQLECAPIGMPVPELIWIHNDIELMDGDHIHIESSLTDDFQSNHTLIIDRIKPSDQGEYRCIAKNRLGQAMLIYPVELQADDVSATTIGLIVGLIALLVVAIAVGVYFWRREHSKWLLLKHAGISYFDNGDMRNYNPDLTRMEQADLLPYDANYEFPRDRLHLSGVKLGSGAFGIVYKATAIGILPGVDQSTVAVKTILSTDKDEHIKALISELKIMIHMGKHVNVVNLLGAVTRNIRKRSLYVIIEYCDLGNLYHFLKKNRNQFVNQVDHVSDVINSDILTIQQQVNEEPDGPPTSTSYFQGSAGLDSDAHLLGNDTNRASSRTTASYRTHNGHSGYVHGGTLQTITTTDLVCWSFQVARGMAFLSSRGVMHGDLAARNILLCSDKVVKIGDFGLSRSLRPEEDYQKESEGPLPLKWLAIESISHKIFNTQSDVWSFGIVMWELFSMAQVPYAEVATEKLLIWLQEGHRMLRPKYATQALHDIMRECWAAEPTHRPRFDALARRLGDMLPSEIAQDFIDMNDEYMKVNIAEGRDKGDYLSVLLTPEAEAPRPPTSLAMPDDDLEYGEDRVPEEIAMLPCTIGGERALTPLARSDTDTDLDQWIQHSTLVNVAQPPPTSPRRLPPQQNSYVNFPKQTLKITAPDASALPSDAVSNPSYVVINNH